MSHRYRPVGAVLSSAALVAAAALTLAAQARMPEAAAEPSTTSPSTTSTSTTSTSTTSTSTSPASGSGSSSASNHPSDEYGFLDSAARCDDSQVLVSFGRTSRALVVICVDPDGELEYRGVRLSDETSLTVTAGRASDGSIVATNNGVTYAVSPEMLLVSEGDTVLYRDSWLEFRQPRFAGEPATTSTSPEAPTTTVSTTTVTVTPDTSNSGGW